MKVTLGNQANVFYDMDTNFYITKGEVKEVTPKVAASKAFKKALQGGHLVEAKGKGKEEAPKEVEKPVEAPVVDEAAKEEPDEVMELQKIFNAMVVAGKTEKQIVDAFNFEQLVALAKANDIEVEKGDTKASIVKVLLGE